MPGKLTVLTRLASRFSRDRRNSATTPTQPANGNLPFRAASAPSMFAGLRKCLILANLRVSSMLSRLYSNQSLETIT